MNGETTFTEAVDKTYANGFTPREACLCNEMECCAVGAAHISLYPSTPVNLRPGAGLYQIYEEVAIACGLPNTFILGVTFGFDDGANSPNKNPDYISGQALGHALREKYLCPNQTSEESENGSSESSRTPLALPT